MCFGALQALESVDVDVDVVQPWHARRHWKSCHFSFCGIDVDGDMFGRKKGLGFLFVRQRCFWLGMWEWKSEDDCCLAEFDDDKKQKACGEGFDWMGMKGCV